METIEKFLERVEADADKRGVYLKPPLSEYELNEVAQSLRHELGLAIPDEYIRLLRLTDGISTQSGYLSPLQEIGEQNAVIWFMQSKSGANAQGNFEIRYEPQRDVERLDVVNAQRQRLLRGDDKRRRISAGCGVGAGVNLGGARTEVHDDLLPHARAGIPRELLTGVALVAGVGHLDHTPGIGGGRQVRVVVERAAKDHEVRLGDVRLRAHQRLL